LPILKFPTLAVALGDMTSPWFAPVFLHLTGFARTPPLWFPLLHGPLRIDIGNFVHTITFDNGKEFAAHQRIAHALKAKIFFATPYHAWERGLNENTNGLIRDFFPKGTDFSTISDAEVAKVERLLNARPRKSLGFRSPQEVFDSLACS
jgi:hypothetical protein